MGIKPTTSLLQGVCSTTWATTTAPHEIFYHMQHLLIRANIVQDVNRLKNEHWYWHAVTGEKLFCQKEWTRNLKKTISRRRKLFKAEKSLKTDHEQNWEIEKNKNEHPLSFPICQKKRFDKIFSEETINFTFLIAVKMHRRLSCSGRLGPPVPEDASFHCCRCCCQQKWFFLQKFSASLLLSFYVSWSIKKLRLRTKQGPVT